MIRLSNFPGSLSSRPRHMPRLIISLCCILLLSLQPVQAADTAGALNAEFKDLLLADEAALQAIDRLMAENNAFAEQGAGLPHAMLSTKVHGIVDPVRERYVKFLAAHPDHVRGHLAYASFLGEFSESPEILQHLEKALALAPEDPVVLNNVAKHHAEHGEAARAFGLIQKALEKRSDEPTYLRNLAGMMQVYRKEATTFFQLDGERQLHSHVTRLYRRAIALQPDDFLLRTALGQALYRADPFPVEEAITAWQEALRLASTPLEREGVEIHLARVHIRHRDYHAARRHLESVTAPELAEEKNRLLTGLPQAMRSLPATSSPKPANLFNVTTAPPPGR
jgi:tetratricopeptide (TPR) repeat protein